MTVEVERSWYVLKDDQQIGPIAEATFREFVSEGLIRKTDFVWRQGLPNWVAAEQVLEFNEQVATRLKPPPLPKHAFSSRSVELQLVPPPLPKRFGVSKIGKSEHFAEMGRGFLTRNSDEGTRESLPKESVSYGATTISVRARRRNERKMAITSQNIGEEDSRCRYRTGSTDFWAI